MNPVMQQKTPDPFPAPFLMTPFLTLSSSASVLPWGKTVHQLR